MPLFPSLRLRLSGHGCLQQRTEVIELSSDEPTAKYLNIPPALVAHAFLTVWAAAQASHRTIPSCSKVWASLQCVSMLHCMHRRAAGAIWLKKLQLSVLTICSSCLFCYLMNTGPTDPHGGLIIGRCHGFHSSQFKAT